MAATTSTRTALAVRPLAPGDIRRARQIERAAYGADSPGTPFERELRNGLAQYLGVTAAPAPGRPQRARPGGVLRAIQRLVATPEPETPPLLGYAGAWFTQDQLHIVTVAVDPPAQGHGVATALLLGCYDLAVESELKTIALEVRVSNERAQRLYARFGFERAGRLRAYYSNNGEDALVMLTPDLASPAHRELIAALRSELARAS
jgi:ribosomal-protein-alanine acetyltransferase